MCLVTVLAWVPAIAVLVALSAYNGIPETMFLAVPLVLLIARSAFLGIYLDGDTVVVRSWFRVHRIETSRISDLTIERYSGLITRGDEHNPFSAYFWVISFHLEPRGVKTFQAAFMPKKRARRVAQQLADELSVDFFDFDTPFG